MEFKVDPWSQMKRKDKRKKIGFLFLLTDKKKNGLYEWFCVTMVLKKPNMLLMKHAASFLIFFSF